MGHSTLIDRDRLQREPEQLAEQGLRVLVLAEKLISTQQTTLAQADLESKLTFLGLQGMIEPAP
ncbi:hypothetical protein AB3R30_16680 [Leptolyngbyaceae cyanobacterium UHCC 1019]